MNIEESDLIRDFLAGHLSETERLSILERMQNDVRFRESVLLEKQMHQTLNKQDWSFVNQVDSALLKEYEVLFKNKETQALKASINKANAKYQSTPKKKTQGYFYLAAAVAVLFVVIGSLMPSTSSFDELYVAYNDISEIPSLVVRGEDQGDSLLEAQTLFEDKKYNMALEVLNKHLPKITKNKATVLLYIGVSHMELGNLDEALATFETLSSSDFIDAPMGLWYKAMVFLKLEKKTDVKETLVKLLSDKSGYKHKEAKELLEKL